MSLPKDDIAGTPGIPTTSDSTAYKKDNAQAPVTAAPTAAPQPSAEALAPGVPVQGEITPNKGSHKDVSAEPKIPDAKSKSVKIPETPERIMIRKLVKIQRSTGTKMGTVDYTKEQLVTVFNTVKPLFKKERMLIRLRAPIRIVGDLHGQYLDLKGHFRANGWPPEVRYLFLGDYVDRGMYSLETVVMLFGLKCLYPGCVVLLRGNHECMNVNKAYGFFDELNRRGFPELYPVINEIFNWMPISAIINQKILCMHGGISQFIQNSLDEINNIARPLKMLPPKSKIPQIAMDILWADPVPVDLKGYRKSHRGVSFEFGMDVLDQFCIKFGLEMVVRGHQVVQGGFERMGPIIGGTQRTRIVTVFSAPNYCNEMDNCAAVMVLGEKLGVRFAILIPSTDKEYERVRASLRKNTPKFDVMPPELPKQPVNAKLPDLPKPPALSKPPELPKPPEIPNPPDLLKPPEPPKPPELPNPPVNSKPPEIPKTPSISNSPDLPKPP